MRIIGGEFRSRQILPPPTDATRPITDRVKQSLFDILAPLIDGARVYDCFAGTGSMGLECLSRGAVHATFFEVDRPAVAVLRKNIATLGVKSRSSVVDRDLFQWFDLPGLDLPAKATKPGATKPGATKPVDLIFLDPPYRFLTDRPDDLRRLAKRMAEKHLAADGVVVFRHDAADVLDLPPFQTADRRDYGGMAIEFLRAVNSRG